MRDKIKLKDFQILFVDHEDGTQQKFRKEFKGDFKVQTTTDGKKALEMIENEEFALVISNQNLNGLSGVELMTIIHERKPNIVRMLYSEALDPDTLLEAINHGNIYRYFKKPYNMLEIRQALQQGIKKYHQIREQDKLDPRKIANLEKLARTNRLTAIGTFAAGMAHEIRNPLTSINTFIAIAPERKDDADFLENFSKVALEDVNRISRLVQEILDYARSSEPKFSEENLNEIIESSLFFIGLETEKLDLSIEKELSPTIPKVSLDRQQIKQVLLNLFMNSMDAMNQKGGTLKVKTLSFSRAKTEYVRIIIEDTGEGIPEDSLEFIFDPFFTTKHESKEREGTGLGLSIVHQIILEHLGTIEVKSQFGQGTTFTINLQVNPLLSNQRN